MQSCPKSPDPSLHVPHTESDRHCGIERVGLVRLLLARGGHSHRRRSHSSDRGQEAVKGSRAVFGVGQAVKDNFQTR